MGTTASSAEPGHPDPQSQSLSRSYGSNLPTSLTYIILSTRGCSPWRPAADMGTSRRESAVTSPGFSRSDRSLVDAERTSALFAREPKPILCARQFEGLGGLCRKDNSSQSSGRRLPVASRCHDRSRIRIGSAAGFRNMNRIPFRRCCGTATLHDVCVKRRTLNQGFPQALGSTDPCSTAVHTEPFSTSALQESLWSICYYHQDLHPGRLQPGSHPKAFRATPATFLLVGASGRFAAPALRRRPGMSGAL